MSLQTLYNVVSPHMQWVANVKIDGRIQFMMALWILATPDSFRSVSRKFGVQRCSVHYVYLRVIKALCAVKGQFIKWPTLAEQELIRDRFLAKGGHFPGVVGCLDGCNVEIKKPQDHPVAFYDRKGNYSMKVQAVCDHTLQFRDVYIGECGSLNDVEMLKRSPLIHKINNAAAFAHDCHIIADAAYSPRQTLMSPYKRVNRNDLTERQKNFNYSLSKSRVTIENAFARLQTKWRRILTTFDVGRLDICGWHIMACCVLHNFIIRGGERVEPEPDEAQVAARLRADNEDYNSADEDEDDVDDVNDNVPVVVNPNNGRGRFLQGQAKRNRIAAALAIMPRPAPPPG